MSSGFAIEVDRKVVGLAVRVPGGFRFFSSDSKFLPFDGRIFRKARSIGRKLAELARSRRLGRSKPSRSRVIR